jgi:hypothetical protein
MAFSPAPGNRTHLGHPKTHNSRQHIITCREVGSGNDGREAPEGLTAHTDGSLLQNVIVHDATEKTSTECHDCGVEDMTSAVDAW